MMLQLMRYLKKILAYVELHMQRAGTGVSVVMCDKLSSNVLFSTWLLQTLEEH